MQNRDPKQTAEEKAIFDAFLTSYPSFAATVVDHSPPEAQFPDRVVRLRDGSQIDFELAQWIHPGQMAQAKRREQLAEAIMNVIGEQGENCSQHFGFVLLFPQPHFPRFAQVDAKRFQEDFWALIEEIERRWPEERFWHSPQGCQFNKFDAYPVLAKYVSKAIFDPRQSYPTGVPWIAVSAPCGSYSSDTALGAFNSILQAKLKSYGGLRRQTRLLVYYGAAVAYNTPWYDIKFRKFSDVAETAAQIVANQSAFERIYLLKALEPKLEAYEIFPVFTRWD